MAAARKLEDLIYTYKMYCEMPDDGNRYEIIDGVPYAMAAPGRRHQTVLREIFGRLFNYLQGKPCEVFVAPFDIRLALYGEPEDEEINVVQPDIVVFCDENKVDEKGGKGAPDIAIEILSPSSARNDRYRKHSIYEKAGVREYWIVDAANRTVEVFVLQDGKFALSALLQESDILTSTVLEGLEISLSDVLAYPAGG